MEAIADTSSKDLAKIPEGEVITEPLVVEEDAVAKKIVAKTSPKTKTTKKKRKKK
jgi:hypothetical protein